MGFRQLKSTKAQVILLIVGIGMAGFGTWSWFEEKRLLADAVEVAAEVLETRVERKRSRRSTSYRPVVRFRFTLDGKTHESDRVTPLDFSGTSSWADEMVARFPVGSTPKAWVNPSSPDKAYLVKETSSKNLAVLGIGVVVALACATALVVKKKRKAAAALAGSES